MFVTRDPVQAVLFASLKVLDNRVRPHSSPGFLPPAELERAQRQTHR